MLTESQLAWCRERIPHFKQCEDDARRIMQEHIASVEANKDCVRYDSASGIAHVQVLAAEEAFANGRLIAAAPEQRVELKAIIALNDQNNTTRAQAKAAIAKATEE